MRQPAIVLIATVALLCIAGARLAAAEEAAASSPTPAAENRLQFDVGWPKGITYELGRRDASLAHLLAPFQEVYLKGRVGLRLDLDAAAFAAALTLPEFHDAVEVRRARFYLLGEVRLALTIGYKFEFSIEGDSVFLNDFYGRWKPGSRFIDTIDIGYLTPPMGLENVVSSRSLTFMEVAAPIQALAPGYRSGIAVSGHWLPWRTAWSSGIYSAGQEQIAGDASKTSAQAVARGAWRPWVEPPEVGDGFAHLGLSASYVFSGESKIRYRAKPESFIAPFVVDTGDITAGDAFQYALEAAWTRGPLLFSGEVLQSFVVDDNGPERTFYGAYGLASWVLTGERRGYNDKTGMFERLQPRRDFSFSGPGWGALEIGQRLSWIDLTDGEIDGGKMLTVTSGVTWHLNPELKFAWNYVFAHVTGSPEPGDVSIFQARIEIGI